MLGRGLILLAAAFAIVSGGFALATKSDARRDASSRRAAAAAFAATAGAMVLLWIAFFRRDFSIGFVAGHTTTKTSVLYTFTGLWSGMDGSLLLWCAMVCAYGAVLARRRGGIPLACVELTAAFFLVMTAFASNPFARAETVEMTGRGMNPLLYSWGMAIHPPLLYAGFTGTAVVFGLAVHGVFTGTSWVRDARGWALFAWLALGAGLVVGGAWAYTELGWGGMWGWDPVENAALAPWLVLTAYIHSAQVEERRDLLRVWNASLAALSFLFAILGTFLTRSGSLYSIHAFAQSPVGWWFLLFLLVAAIVAGVAIAVRSPRLRTSGALDAMLSREVLFLLNNVLFVGLAAAVLIASDVVPALSQAIGGRRVVVGAPFYNRTGSPILAVIVVLAAVGIAVPWRRGSASRLFARFLPSIATGAVLAGFAYAMSRSVIFAVAAAAAAFVAGVHVDAFIRDARARGVTRLFAANRRRYGAYVVHIGVAIALLGFAGSLLKTQRDVTLRKGDTVTFRGHTITFDGLRSFSLADREVVRADLVADGRPLRPQIHTHPGWEAQPRSRAGIVSTFAGDLYVFLRAYERDGTVSVVLHDNPLQPWVWVGVLISGLGGVVCLTPSRRRTPARTLQPA